MKEYKNKKEFKLDLINLSPVEVYEEVLSGRYITRFPKYYWEKPEALSNAKEAMKYLVEKKLKLTDDELMQLSNKILLENKLYGMITTLFNNSPFKAIENAYPGKFKRFQYYIRGRNYWNDQNAKDAVIWLIEEKLKLTDDEVVDLLSFELFAQNGLWRLIRYFNNSPFKAIENAYPGKFKIWEFNRAGNCYWDKEIAKQATIWLIEEKLKLKDEEIIEKLSMELFKENKLYGMICILFNNSPFKAIENAYPGRFNINDFTTRNKKEK